MLLLKFVSCRAQDVRSLRLPHTAVQLTLLYHPPPTSPSRFHLNTRCRHSPLTSEYNQPFLSPLPQLYPQPGRRRRNNYGIAWHHLQTQAGVVVRLRAGERKRRSAWRLGNTAVRRVCYWQIEDNVDEEDIIKRAFSRGVVVVGCNANKINTNVERGRRTLRKFRCAHGRRYLL